MARLLQLALILLSSLQSARAAPGVIRYNLLGYPVNSLKVAVYGSKVKTTAREFQLVSVSTGKTVFTAPVGKDFGNYGPFVQSFRLDFSRFAKAGSYILKCGEAVTRAFTLADEVYKGSADFCLRYMRQQRSGFNPFLKDSCHTHDGYTLYGPMRDSTHVNVSGGWHDASDYLQYSSTSANATYHLLMAARDFPAVFKDHVQGNGLDGTNGTADILDEARWGLEWLLKMHPSPQIMYNQLGDDRDHQGMRIPKQDSFYGKGFERPVYFINGKPQQRGKYLNNTNGTSSTAGKFASAFALGSELFRKSNAGFSALLVAKAGTALDFAMQKPGVTQTVSVRSPYIYAEDNWTDDMELANAALSAIQTSRKLSAPYLKKGAEYAKREPVTPWLSADTANHYQWYPFINIGHHEMSRQTALKPDDDPYLDFYKQGIKQVWSRAKENAFFRGVPFIWCSNNLTTAFAIQCYWYRVMSKDNQFAALEQANFDWLFGCNPWGTSMVYGLPGKADTPSDPHSAFTHLKNYPIDGGLVDGPVYGSIYKSLIGISLKDPDEYAEWQSDLAVYHDDYGDYSTNEPTMDGTASLVYLLAAKEAGSGGKRLAYKTQVMAVDVKSAATGPIARVKRVFQKKQPAEQALKPSTFGAVGPINRGDSNKRIVALVFTGHEFGDGGKAILTALKQEKVKASFFLTGDFYRNPQFRKTIQALKTAGHYLGPHSDKHLLYAPWEKRDSLLVSKEEFTADIDQNYAAMKPFGLSQKTSPYFLPPYEWYNDSIAAWAKEMGLQLVNYTGGTLGNADYTTPDMPNYRTSDSIYQSITHKAGDAPTGINGHIMLLHIGVDPARPDKFYNLLPLLLQELTAYGYRFVRIDQLLREANNTDR